MSKALLVLIKIDRHCVKLVMFKVYKKVIKLSVTLIYIWMCNQVSLRPLMIAVLYMKHCVTVRKKKLVWFQIYIDTFKLIWAYFQVVQIGSIYYEFCCSVLSHHGNIYRIKRMQSTKNQYLNITMGNLTKYIFTQWKI